VVWFGLVALATLQLLIGEQGEAFFDEIVVLARTARRVPPSASLATDHSGHAAPSRALGRRSGLKCMCPRRQRFTRSGPADLGEADRDGRGCVAANGEYAGRSLRAGRRARLVGSLRSDALSLAPHRGAREGASESAQMVLSVVVVGKPRCQGIAVVARERLRS